MSNLSEFLGSGGGKLRYQEFTSSGTFTPSAKLLANGGQVYYELIGGGGSGAVSNQSSCGGDAGAYVRGVITVTGAVTVTIGAGGAAVSSTVNTAGNPGSASSIGSLVTASGGFGAPLPSSNNNAGGGRGAGGIGFFTTDTSAVLDARGGVGINGKAGGGGGTVQAYGEWHMRAVDGGGAGNYGVGTVTATSAVSNSGGGGGGAVSSTGGAIKTSGAGGSGWCRIVWFE